MKINQSFITNSSSTSYLAVKTKPIEELIKIVNDNVTDGRIRRGMLIKLNKFFEKDYYYTKLDYSYDHDTLINGWEKLEKLINGYYSEIVLKFINVDEKDYDYYENLVIEQIENDDKTGDFNKYED